MNDIGTSDNIGKKLTQRRSRHVRFELVDKSGEVVGTFMTGQAAVARAQMLWPDQEQDEDHEGKGWDIQVVQRP